MCSSDLTSDTQSCGCYQKEKLSKRSKIEYGLSSKKAAYGVYKDGAKKRNLSFNLTFDQFLILTQQNCFYCGSKPNNLYKNICGNGNFIYNGIDRLDNTKGYTLDNVVPCCYQCNWAKRDLSINEFISWVNRIYERKMVIGNDYSS